MQWEGRDLRERDIVSSSLSQTRQESLALLSAAHAARRERGRGMPLEPEVHVREWKEAEKDEDSASASPPTRPPL